MKKTNIFIFLIIIAFFGIAFYFYPQLPDKVASHWNARGEADDYMSKFWGLFLMPFISIGIALLFILIPRIDPLKKNIEKFRKHYDRFIVLILLFFLYVYILTIFWNTGYRFNMTNYLVPAFGVLFYYIGTLVEHAKRNWFIGIRTPWTLSSDEVWNKTHKLGGKLFKIAGIIALFGILFPVYGIFVMVIPVISVSVFLVVYSYFAYKKLSST